METTRQSRIARQIQKDMADIFRHEGLPLVQGVVASVTEVRLSPDLGYARVWVSIFPFERSAAVVEELQRNTWLLRRALSTRMRHQLRTMPELQILRDESEEYAAGIDKLLDTDR